MLPEEPGMSADDLTRWDARVEVINAHFDEIKAAGAWQPVPDCPACKVEGKTPPEDGCEEHHPYIDWTPSAWQAEVCYDTANFVAASAGNGAGKSFLLAALVTMLSTGFPPRWFLHPDRIGLLPLLPWPKAPGFPKYLYWIVGVKRSNLAKGPVKYIRDFLDGTPWLLPKGITEVPLGDGVRLAVRFELLHSVIEVKSQEQEKEAFASEPHLHGAFEDEELKGATGDAIRSEIRSRFRKTRGRYWWMVTAFDSADRGGDSDVVQNIIEPGLLGELPPDRYSVREVCTGENTHMTQEERDEQYLQHVDPASGAETSTTAVRWYGRIVGINLSPILHQGPLDYFRSNIKPPVAEGFLADKQNWQVRGDRSEIPAWVEAPTEKLSPTFVNEKGADGGPLYVWEYPERHHEYVIGCDGGHGIKNGHPNAAWVFNRMTGRYVAMWWVSEESAVDFGLTLCRLGWFYNHAWVIVARGTPGPEIISILAGAGAARRRYDRIYMHGKRGDWPDTDWRKLGYPETESDKQVLFATFNDVIEPKVRFRPETIEISMPDAGTIRELKSFRRDDKGKTVKPERQEGYKKTHCDRAEAAMLCIVAHRSESCPMPRREELREPLSDPLSEWAMQENLRKMESAKKAKRASLGARRFPMTTRRKLPMLSRR